MGKPESPSLPVRVLCILTEPVFETELRRQLAAFGVQYVYGLEAALEHLALGQVTPDVMLVQLPDAAAQRLDEILHADRFLSLIPVVLLLDSHLEHDPGRLLSLGASALLVYPEQAEQLPALVRAHADTRRNWWQTFHIEAPEQPEQLLKFLRQLHPEAAATEIKDPFQQFRRFVLRRTGLSPEGSRSLPSYSAGEVYALGSAVGLNSWQTAEAICEFLHIPLLESLSGYTLNSEALPAAFCRRNLVLPTTPQAEQVTVVLANPFQLEVVDILKRRFKSLQLCLAPPELIETLLNPAFLHTQRYQEWLLLCQQREKARAGSVSVPPDAPAEAGPEMPAPSAPVWNEGEVQRMEQRLMRAYQAYHLQKQTPSGSEALPELLASDRDPEVAPIIYLVNSLIEKAHLLGASDLHIEPGEDEVLIRCRIDGQMQVLHRLQPQGIIKPIITRLKIMGELDISEKRLPQDGQIPFVLYSPAHNINLRLSVVPLRYGEKAVLRLLDSQRGLVSLGKMGFEPEALALYRQQIRAPYGMILHVGPTGSGKTTTLYGALSELNSPERNIHTIENPIEYTLKGINQLEIRHDIGLDFARTLRAYLRQDPDVILVGEIRDAETAHVAIEAALTGHLLLSTLHTNDAASTILRLLEMQIPTYLISSSLLLICAQRLLRKLCFRCRRAYMPDPDLHRLLQLADDAAPVTLYAAVGCSHCHHTGYSGRVGVYELLIPNEELRQLMNRPQVTAEAIKQAAVNTTQMRTLFQEGVAKALAGLTSAEEITLKLLPDLKFEIK